MKAFKPIQLKSWIEQNRHLLKPPVNNKVIWKDSEFIVMVVGGPNQRTDFHVNEGEEFFYQLEGEINLRLARTDGEVEDVPIRAGDVFLLPGRTPHSPQRREGSVGLVVERQRRPEEKDGLQWYCEACHQKLYEEFFILTNIETQFAAVFERYYGSSHTRCKSCGFLNGPSWKRWVPTWQQQASL